MKIKTTFSIELDENDIKTAIRQYLDRQYGVRLKNSWDINLKVNKTTRGMGMMEYDQYAVTVNASREDDQ